MRGIADFIPDPTPYLGDDWAKVLAVRTQCDAPEPVWRARLAELAVWGNAQPVDSVLGVRRAIEAFRRLKQNDSGIGPTYFSDLIRTFYTAHGRFTRTAREAYLENPFLRLMPPEDFLNDAAGVPYLDVIDVGRPNRVWRHVRASWH